MTPWIMQYNLKSIFVRYIPNVAQLKFSLHLIPMHMSLFSDRLIIDGETRTRSPSVIHLPDEKSTKVEKW